MRAYLRLIATIFDRPRFSMLDLGFILLGTSLGSMGDPWQWLIFFVGVAVWFTASVVTRRVSEP